ncbi:hypothetical protein BWI17_14670 [Betaproteobacteria bacterium GR16-43]|nr:hypothetical protein BWI17_14670 [Betaproteobacteria bacterium GR16-43]
MVLLTAFDASSQAPIWSKEDHVPIASDQWFANPPRSMAVAPNGDAIAVGAVGNDIGSNVAVIRYSGATGAVAWINSQLALPYGFLEAVAVDGAGHVIATGSTYVGHTEAAVTIKFDAATGAVLWTAIVYQIGRGTAIAIGPGNHVYITGYANFPDLGDMTAVKLDSASGAVLWAGSYPGVQADGGAHGGAIVVDAAGDAYVTGQSGPASGLTFQVARFSGANGSLTWSRGIGGVGGRGRDLRIDAAGDVIVVGEVEAGAGLRFCAAKLAKDTGVETWTRCVEGTAAGAGRANSVSLDAAGNAYATGSTQGLDAPEMRTVKFAAATGLVQWSRVATHKFPGVVTGIGQAIGGAANGSPVATGELRVPDPGSFLFTSYPMTVRYSPLDGTPTWSIGGTVGSPAGYGRAVATDAADNVLIAGVGSSLYGVHKVSGASGVELWEAAPSMVSGATMYAGPNFTLRSGRLASLLLRAGSTGQLVLRDAATGNTAWSVEVDGALGAGTDARVAIDGAGDVVYAGMERVALGFQGSARTAKRSHVDGAVVWSADYSVPSTIYSRANVLALDSEGHAVVGGSTCRSVHPRFGSCFDQQGWVRKLDAATGALQWHVALGSFESPSLAVDPSNHVFAGAGPSVFKLNASTGAVLWQDTASGSSAVQLIALASGNVVVLRDSGVATVVTHRDGSTGAALWEATIPSPGNGGLMALLPGGDIVVLSYDYLGERFGYRLLRLSGADGTILWSRREVAASGSIYARGVTVDPDGNVHVALTLNVESNLSMRVAKFNGASGAAISDKAYSNATATVYTVGILSDSTGLYLAGYVDGTGLPRAALTLKLDFGATVPFHAASLDFDGNGRSDLLWRHTDGRTAIWLMDGLVPITASEVPTFGPGPVTRVNDANGDGRADLFMEGPTGAISGLLMNGTFYSSAFYMGNGSGWHIGGTGDLDGDGTADLVLQHTDGRVLAWTRITAGVAGQATILGAGTGWVVSRLADFNGDGEDDILFRHPDGRHAIWLMDGTTPTSQVQILNAGGWTATHAPDLNADGTADILWQHTDGTVAAWLMDGTSMVSGATLLAAGSGWTVTHTADFDGDGRDDLFFTHTDGRAAIYLMNGLVPMQTTQILNAGSGWSAKRMLDLNGDGKADIVWEHTDGRVAAWLMNGTAMVSGSEILGPGTGWSVNGAAK